MARMRMISPRFFTDAKLFDAESASGFPLMLAFAGLWCQADREGRFRWRPRLLRNEICPWDEVDFGGLLEALGAAGYIVRYDVGGESYGFIPTFLKHQRPNHREAESQLPPPPGHEQREDIQLAPGERWQVSIRSIRRLRRLG